MASYRTSLSGLLAFVAVVALWLASLRTATSWWTTAAAWITLGLLLGGVLGAWLLRGPERGFALGFALFGCVHLILVNWDWIGAQLGRDLSSGLAEWAERVFPPEPALAPAATAKGANLAYFERVRNRTMMLGNFVQIGRLTFTLLFALVGGVAGRWMVDRSERRHE